MRQLDDWLESYIAYASDSEAPDIYNKWVGISVLASALERKVWIEWDEETYPNFYIALVGPSGGGRKGTAMRMGRNILSEINVNLSPDAITRRAIVSALENSSNVFTVGNEQQVHCSLTVYSEEFTVFLDYDNKKFMANLCDWFDCKKIWEYSTEHSGGSYIRNVWLNIIGATTPTLLNESLATTAIGGGLTSRMIFVYAPRKSKTVIFPFIRPHKALESALIDDLREIHEISGVIQPSQSFLDLWEKWYPNEGDKLPYEDPRLGGYLNRRAKHVLKLSIIFSISDSSNMIVTDKHLAKAISTLEEAERGMRRALGGAGVSTTAAATERILTQLELNGDMTYRELFNALLYDMDRDVIDKALTALVIMGAIKFERAESGKLEDRLISIIRQK